MKEMAAWYQKKIGTYDKQEWETTIEQRILHGLQHVPFKSAKLRPDLIDVDLVRGSSFPKAKPVQGLTTVVRLALARVFIFPLWSHWWAAHTSLSASRFLFVLWGLQLFNTILYLIAPSTVRLDGLSIIVPFCLMAGLGVVHALIVSTSPPRPYDHRYRSLNSDDRRPRLRVSTTPDVGILRQKTSISSDDAINSSSLKPKNLKKSLADTVSVATQTKNEEIDDDKVEETYTEWLGGHQIPTVSLTPPPSVQSVSFDLAGLNSADGESSKEETQHSPVNQRRRRINLRNTNPEGDDGFESLNGNNSNESENGDEPAAEEDDNEPKDSEDDSPDDSNDKKDDKAKSINKQNEKVVNDILYKNKFTKRLIKNSDSANEGPNDNIDWRDDVVFEEVSVGSGSTVRFRDGLRVCSDGGSSTNLSGDQLRSRERRTKSGVRFRNSWVQEFLEQRHPMAEATARNTRNSCQSSSSEEECDTASASLGVPSQHTDWVGQTTNSEECSYSSGHEESEWEGRFEDPAWEPCAILSPATDRVSCTIWERGRVMKAHLSAVDISRAVVRRAEGTLARTSDGLWPGTLVATLLAALPPAAKLLQILIESEAAGAEQVTIWDLPGLFFFNSPIYLIYNAFGSTMWERVINVISAALRLGLGALVFFLLAVAERAFRQRFLYAKLFSHLTSARRARQSSLPHFRLNRVRNIKTWLSVRSYLKRRGPQRSVDVIVSAAFFMMVLLISYLVVQLLNESGQTDGSRAAEAFGWVLSLGLVLLRLAALGTRAARKHRCLPVLLTEQINLHLAMERRPAGKDRLVVANNVLKLAADLLKELERPFKISGLSANPYLYTITKVVILSALSGVLSEILGFKLKLHKIKIK